MSPYLNTVSLWRELVKLRLLGWTLANRRGNMDTHKGKIIEDTGRNQGESLEQSLLSWPSEGTNLKTP